MPTLVYSPVNWLIIDWRFDHCGLPQPKPCAEPDEEKAPECKALPVVEYPETYDWARFLPEVMVGVEEPDADIAANYVRQAAIEFARDARVLQRDLVIDLEAGVNQYMLHPFPDERIEGILEVELDGKSDCHCSSGLRGGSRYLGFDWEFDTSRNVLHLNGQPRTGRLTIRVWAVPTEDACTYDRFLYDNFRADIALGARRYYVMANHFRDRFLVGSLPPQERWNFAIITALKRARRVPEARKQPAGSGMWVGNGMRRFGGRGSF